MLSSFRSRFGIAIGVTAAAGVFASAYILAKFKGYEDRATAVMSGDQKAVLLGHLIEARIKAAEELALNSVTSEQANEVFRQRIHAIAEDIKPLDIENAKRLLAEVVGAKQEVMEDLFVHYRNMKTSAFNLYRACWGNRWMGVARNMGLVINDLDNLPYHGGEKAAASVTAKINQTAAMVTGSLLPAQAKLQLFAQLNALKLHVGRYLDAIQKADVMREKRVEDLRSLAGMVKRYNEQHGRSLLQFTNEARSEVFKGILAFLLLLLFAVLWPALAVKRVTEHLMTVAAHVAKQMTEWVTAGGNITAQEFKIPERPDAELTEMYHSIDRTMRRVNSLRKEDILVKRLLNVPFLLINRGKQSIFWNSALSIVAKVRALEELGPVGYPNLVKFTTAQGKIVDPIDRAFSDNKEVSQLALLRVGGDGIAVHVVCTPVLGHDNRAEYVMVHIRDLREENRRAEAELERQLECVTEAVRGIESGGIPADPPTGLRKPVVECMRMLKAHAIELQQRMAVATGQAETMRERMAREAKLKAAVHGRSAQVKAEIESVRTRIQDLRACAESTASKLGEVETRGQALRHEYEGIKRRGTDLHADLMTARELIFTSIGRLQKAEEVSARVRSHERMIQGILEKSSLLNANNSIIGAKRELTPSDVITITENVSQLMGQFERTYRFIEESVGEMETGIQELTTELRESLSACVRVTGEDEGLLKSIEESERALASGTSQIGEFLRELMALKTTAGRLDLQIRGVESKIQRLVDVGKASLQLQTALERGFQGMAGTAAPEPVAQVGETA